MNADQQLNAGDYWLLVLVTLAWGFSFPIIKFAVNTYPTITYRTICLVIGMISLGLFLFQQKQSFKVKRSEWFAIFKVVFVTMTLWQIGLIFGVKLLNGGRAAIIGYTFPVWALIGSIVFYKAPFTWRSLIGVLLALGATTLLAVSELDKFLTKPLGILVTLGAAMAWGFGTAITRHTPLTISNQLLAFWSLVITLIVFTPLAIGFEFSQWRLPTVAEMLAMLYGGVVTFAFCYVAWFRLSRKLPAAVSGLSIMLVPPISVIGGTLFFGVPMTTADVFAMGLIIIAMSIVLRSNKGSGK